MRLVQPSYGRTQNTSLFSELLVSQLELDEAEEVLTSMSASFSAIFSCFDGGEADE